MHPRFAWLARIAAASLAALAMARPVWAQAEGVPEAPSIPPTSVSLDAHFAFLAGVATGFSPRYGYGVRLGAATRARTLGPLDLVLGAEMTHDRFTARDVSLIDLAGGGQAEIPDARELFETSAAATALLCPSRWRLRPYLQLGLGLSWAFYHAPNHGPGATGSTDDQTVAPLARLDLGLELLLRRDLSLRLGGELTEYWSHDTVVVAGAPTQIFGPIGDIVLGVDYRF